MIHSFLVAMLAAAPAPIHVKIDGEGYFRFARGMQAVYASDVSLINQNGLICATDGLPLLPQTRLVPGAKFNVSMDGTVTSSGKQIGRIVIADFPANTLQKSGKYWITNTRSQIGFPGDGIFGIIKGATNPSSSSASQVSTPKTVSQPTIEISLKTEIEKSNILLGDIATVQGSKSLEDQIAGIDLGTSPLFGSQRGITRIYVLAAMRHAGIDTDKLTLLCPQGAFVVRKGQTVAADDLINAAKAGVKQQLGDSEDLRATSAVSDLTTPTGQLNLNTIQAVSAGDGYTVNLEVDVDGKMFCRRTINLMPTNPVVKVKAGDPVKIRVLKNGASVEVQGKIRTGGKIGGVITVETDAGASFTGTLISPSVVVVNL